jgi:hypothetical protein
LSFYQSPAPQGIPTSSRPSSNGPEFGNNLADRMATADPSGPFQWPLIEGMVAVDGAGDVAVDVQEML